MDIHGGQTTNGPTHLKAVTLGKDNESETKNPETSAKA